MPDSRLAIPLESAALEDARTRHLKFLVNKEGKITCSDRDTGTVGIGRSPLLAYEDWREKLGEKAK